MKRVILHIDRLVLRGFAPGDRHALAAGLQQELGRVLADPALTRSLTSGDARPHLRLADVRVASGARAQATGAQVARGIARGLRK